MEYIYEEQKGPGPCKDFQTLSLSGAKSFEAQEKMVVETMRAAAAGRPAVRELVDDSTELAEEC